MKLMIGVVVAGFALAGCGGLLWGQEEMSDDPLTDIATDMNSAATRLAKFKTDKPTQKNQQDAIKRLDLLIKELEERMDGDQSGALDPNPKDPAQRSTIRQGPGGMGKLQAERKEGKQWGELPPKERERILQSMNDGFPSHYRKLLERYFVRLADEKPATEPADEPASGGKSPSGSADGAPGGFKAKTDKDAP